MTRADALYWANTYEAQAAYYAWMAEHLQPGSLADSCAQRAATLAAWAKQLRSETGSAA